VTKYSNDDIELVNEVDEKLQVHPEWMFEYNSVVRSTRTSGASIDNLLLAAIEIFNIDMSTTKTTRKRLCLINIDGRVFGFGDSMGYHRFHPRHVLRLQWT
jgi:hypothetical protein